MKLRHLILLPPLFLLSCGASDDAPTKTGSATPKEVVADLEGGTEYFETCKSCHGETGKGDGAASGGLSPKPRDLTDKTWQASVDDEYLRNIILSGGGAVGKSVAMPSNPLLRSKPAVMKGLIAHIRKLAK